MSSEKIIQLKRSPCGLPIKRSSFHWPRN
jgi:hypothetical protein